MIPRNVKIGNATDLDAATGCTVILCEAGATAGVDVRGGGPATRETDLLKPENMVQQIHAVVLSGGSAYGLDAASGVMRWLEERGFGFDVGVARVPLVCGASRSSTCRLAGLMCDLTPPWGMRLAKTLRAWMSARCRRATWAPVRALRWASCSARSSA